MLAKLRDVLMLLIAATTASAQWSVPPLALPREAQSEARAASLRLPESAPTRAIVLKPPTAGRARIADRRARAGASAACSRTRRAEVVRSGSRARSLRPTMRFALPIFRGIVCRPARERRASH
jgi:hypothetical protein